MSTQKIRPALTKCSRNKYDGILFDGVKYAEQAMKQSEDRMQTRLDLEAEAEMGDWATSFDHGIWDYLNHVTSCYLKDIQILDPEPATQPDEDFQDHDVEIYVAHYDENGKPHFLEDLIV